MLWAETGPRHSGTGRRLTIVTDLDGLTLSAVSSMDVLYFLEVCVRVIASPTPYPNPNPNPNWTRRGKGAVSSPFIHP